MTRTLRRSGVREISTQTVALVTRDARLRRRAVEAALDRPIDLTILDCPDEVRHRRLVERGALLVDPTDPDLLDASGLGVLPRPDRELIARALDADLPRTRILSRRDVGAAIAAAAELCRPRPVDAADSILGVSAAAWHLREQVRSVAAFPDISVLILGETGTGKELVARSIHELSAPGRPFVAVNCAAIADHLVESELFGHAAGSFTGASGVRTGLMEAADDGTLFLDEIGEMPTEMQSALLRAIEYRTFRPVGSNRDVPMRARVLAATNRLSRRERKRLRRDLYFRLAGVTVRTAPLRTRSIDVPCLVGAFMSDFERRHGLGGSIEPSAVDLLCGGSWPGNVRELQAVVGHAAILSRGRPITADHVHAALTSRLDMRSSIPPPAPSESDEQEALRPLPALEKEMIERAMSETRGNVSRAARLLEVPRSTLRDKLIKYGLR